MSAARELPADLTRSPVALVVDDDPVMRVLVRQTLQRDGFTVVEAEDGEQGLAAFVAESPDVILLDVMMPRLDGFETCQRVRQFPHGERVPILMLTGLEDVASINRAYDMGATDFIAKPINWDILAHRVRYMLRASRAFADLALREAQLTTAQRVARLGHWDWNVESGAVNWSQQVPQLLGVRPSQLEPNVESLLSYVHVDDRDATRQFLQQAGQGASGGAASTLCRVIGTESTRRVLHIHAESVTNRQGKVERVHGAIQDVTERKEAEDRIRYLAYYDNLTGLPNRAMFHDQLQRGMAQAKRDQTLLALMFLDIDHFKRINDTFGHSVGDELLSGVARRLIGCVRGEDSLARVGGENSGATSVARLGGDEFTLMLPKIADAQDAGRVARRILSALAQPFELNGQSIFVSASIGISVYPLDGAEPGTLLMNADSAMYHAKEAGRNNYQYYASSMNAKAAQRLALESDLRRAIERNEFEVVYQPQLDLASGKIASAEALVRWKHPERGEIMPSEFIPVAEESGLILQLGAWVLKAACREAKRWQTAGCRPIPVAVNVSGLHFRRKSLLQSVERALIETGLDAQWLELEVTESVLMQDTEITRAIFEGLAKLGVKISIDDFGTGYSSLAYLKRFSPYALKIDQSFVRDLETDPDDAAIVRSIIALGHGLKVRVVAEGVETLAQLEFLKAHSCDLLQGYHIGRPMPGAALQARLERGEVPVGKTHELTPAVSQ